MRKKLFFRLMTLCLSLLPLYAWAERVAPTMPTAVAPVSGESYYLYNVEADMFMNYVESSNTYVGVQKDNAMPVKVTLENNGSYSFYFNGINGSYYGYVYSNAVDYARRGKTSLDSYCYWTINAASGVYTIQRSGVNSSYFNADQYLGWVGDPSSSYVYANRTIDDAIHWKFFTISDGDRYQAERRLYHALESSDAYVGNGWSLTYFENAYTNRANLSPEELTNIASSLTNGTGMSAGYEAPEWNEYPIFFHSSDNWGMSSTTGSKYYFSGYISGQGTKTLNASVVVDQDATFVYELEGPTSNASIDIYVDGIQTRHLYGYKYYNPEASDHNLSTLHDRFFEKLEAGTHTITWVYNRTTTDSYGYSYIIRAGCVATPLIEVSLMEPGSLGTEVLYQTDHIKNVKKLKVSGRMNDDDWEKITTMMTNLFEIDLKDVVNEEIPEYGFYNKFLNKVILPDVLKSIGDYAFSNTFVEEISFPSSLTSIGKYAFRNTHLRNVILPDSLETIGNYAFWNNRQAEIIDLGKKIKVIPEQAFHYNYYAQINMPNTVQTINSYAFASCSSLDIDKLPSSLKTIGQNAFGGCTKLKAIIPEGVTTIGSEAFYNTAYDTLYIPNSITSLSYNAFNSCSKLKYAVLPSSFYQFYSSSSGYKYFGSCGSLNRIRLECPTVVFQNYGISPAISGITLEVPSFLVNSYKLDSYWYNAKAIEGFETSEITEWTINNPLILNHERMNGNPDIIIKGDQSRLPSLKINGDNEQTIQNLSFNSYASSRVNYPGQILSNCDHVTVNGNVCVDLLTSGNYWYFFSLPFDIKVSEIAPQEANTQFAIRYYDGANRATYGASGSWKNYDANDVIPAGTGFIIQTNANSTVRFTALDNAKKQNVVANSEFVRQLDLNPAEASANRGWNLIGNPYQCYYNNHSLNFTGPITVWNANNKTYTAYSTTDDDYAIRPNEAFFVQCPGEELPTISFPLQGRQLNAVIESQNAVKMREAAKQDRQLIDIRIYDDEFSDQTRIVLNPDASLDYEIGSDANKFLSAEGEIAQIYTLDSEGTEYAINERPIDDGIIQLGLYATKSGQYTFTMPRCDAEQVILTDNYANISINLKEQDYGFSTQEGIDEGRFTIRLIGNQATDIAELEQRQTKVMGVDGGINIAGVTGNAQIYSIDGRQIANTTLKAEGETLPLPQGTYIVRFGTKSLKVLVK